jgi:hypothetical protein
MTGRPRTAGALPLLALLLAVAPAHHAAPSIAYGEEAIALLGLLNRTGIQAGVQSFAEQMAPSRLASLLRSDSQLGVGRGSKKLVYSCACLLPDTSRAPGTSRRAPPQPPKGGNYSQQSKPPPPAGSGQSRMRRLLEQEQDDETGRGAFGHGHGHDPHGWGDGGGVWNSRQGRQLLQLVQADLADPRPASVPSLSSGLPKLHRCAAEPRAALGCCTASAASAASFHKQVQHAWRSAVPCHPLRSRPGATRKILLDFDGCVSCWTSQGSCP